MTLRREAGEKQDRNDFYDIEIKRPSRRATFISIRVQNKNWTYGVTCLFAVITSARRRWFFIVKDGKKIYLIIFYKCFYFIIEK